MAPALLQPLVSGNSDCILNPAAAHALRLPIDPLNAGDPVEVTISTENRQGMLLAQRGNPQIIGGNWCARSLEVEADTCVVARRLLVDVKHSYSSDPFTKPVFVFCPVTGLRDSKTIFAQDDHGNGQLLRVDDYRQSAALAVGCGR